jgi:hypothetical protein
MRKLIDYIKQSVPGRAVRWVFRNPYFIVVIILLGVVGHDKGVQWYDEYMVLYEEANNKIEEEENTGGLEWTKIDDQLYTLIGTVKEGDCGKIAKQMPDSGYFTVILESPGGNLADGSCLAAHMKLRNVVTVVRSTPVLNQLGETIYTPGTNSSENMPAFMENKSICASACGLLFLAGDKRYLIGEVYFGIHGPGTPPGSRDGASAGAIESSAFRTASSLLQLLKSLGVEDESTRMLFIQIPNATMYWLHPRDFQAKPGLIRIATDYRDFFGTTGSDPEGGMR